MQSSAFSHHFIIVYTVKPFKNNKQFEKKPRDLDLITPLTESYEPINFIRKYI